MNPETRVLSDETLFDEACEYFNRHCVEFDSNPETNTIVAPALDWADYDFDMDPSCDDDSYDSDYCDDDDDDYYDDSMDGDHDSAMRDAGWGYDEQYYDGYGEDF